MDADVNQLTLTFSSTLTARTVPVGSITVTATPSSAGVWTNSGAGTIGGNTLTLPMTLSSGTGAGITGGMTTLGTATVTDASAQTLVIPGISPVTITH